MKDIKIKSFLSFDSQINLLKDRGLIIKNEKKLLWYLKSYNYQNFISGYNDPFMSGFRRKNNKYSFNSTSESIIDLFNFDRSISSILLSNIQNIERKLNTSCAYYISKKLNDLEINNGSIFCLNEENWNKIFKTKKIKKKYIDLFKKKFECCEKNILIKKYNYVEEIPIWVFLLIFSFGELLKLIGSLNNSLQKEIISNSFDIEFESFENFRILLDSIKNIRNRICHNNVLYNIKTSKNSNGLKKFLKKN